MEKELEEILIECRNAPPNRRDYKPIYRFFTKVIQTDKKITINDSLSKLIGFLSSADNGLIWPIAKDTLIGYKPQMMVPPLHVSREQYTPKRPKRPPLSARSPVIQRTLLVTPKRSTIKKKNGKIVTDRDILPSLVLSPEKDFYYCQPKEPSTGRAPSSMSYRIHKKEDSLSSNKSDVQTLNLHGLVKIGSDKIGNFTPLKNFLNYKEQVYMTQQLPVFQNWHRNKAFIKWYYLLRMKRHKRTEKLVNETCPLESRTFTDVFFKIRKTIFTVFQACHPVSKDLPAGTFAQLKENSELSLEEMRKQVESLNEQIRVDLEHFFEQIRGIAFLLRSDYEVLKKIGALPKSLLPYAVNDQASCPSITSIRIRNKLLFQERVLSHSRKEYLPRFFTMVRLFMRDFTVGQVSATLNELYSRFNEENPTTQNLVELTIDENIGLGMEPSLDGFIEWFESVDKKIWTIFLTYTLELSDEAKMLLYQNEDGSYDEMPEIKTEKTTILTPEITKNRDIALSSIKKAYEYFERRLEAPRSFFLKTMARINFIKGIKDYKSTEDFMKLMAEFKATRESIENQQRMFICGSFYTDMKVAKMSLMKSLQAAMEGTKSIGISKAQELFDHIQEHRRRFITEFANSALPDPKAKKELLLILQGLSNEFMSISSSIQSNWTEGLADLNEKQEIVKEILNFAQNALKKKKAKKKVKKAKEEKEDVQ